MSDIVYSPVDFVILMIVIPISLCCRRVLFIQVYTGLWARGSEGVRSNPAFDLKRFCTSPSILSALPFVNSTSLAAIENHCCVQASLVATVHPNAWKCKDGVLVVYRHFAVIQLRLPAVLPTIVLSWKFDVSWLSKCTKIGCHAATAALFLSHPKLALEAI